jgi:hypothetical protein
MDTHLTHHRLIFPIFQLHISHHTSPALSRFKLSNYLRSRRRDTAARKPLPPLLQVEAEWQHLWDPTAVWVVRAKEDEGQVCAEYARYEKALKRWLAVSWMDSRYYRMAWHGGNRVGREGGGG